LRNVGRAALSMRIMLREAIAREKKEERQKWKIFDQYWREKMRKTFSLFDLISIFFLNEQQLSNAEV
jgi:hypothetical protein